MAGALGWIRPRPAWVGEGPRAVWCLVAGRRASRRGLIYLSACSIACSRSHALAGRGLIARA
eukprot:9053952-Pyramimonas_sp.AAC.1